MLAVTSDIEARSAELSYIPPKSCQEGISDTFCCLRGKSQSHCLLLPEDEEHSYVKLCWVTWHGVTDCPLVSYSCVPSLLLQEGIKQQPSMQILFSYKVHFHPLGTLFS